jgi:hypothetical protein
VLKSKGYTNTLASSFMPPTASDHKHFENETTHKLRGLIGDFTFLFTKYAARLPNPLELCDASAPSLLLLPALCRVAASLSVQVLRLSPAL